MKHVARLTFGGWLLVVFAGLVGLYIPVHGAEDPLLIPEAAFGAKARTLDAKSIEVRFDIAPDHYLYRQRFRIEMDGKSVPASRVNLPKGRVKSDPTFGRVETYEGVLTLRLRSLPAKGAGPVELKVTSQGCAAKAGVCYPPFTQSFVLSGSSSDWVAATGRAEGSFDTKPSLKSLVQKP
jgi:thiol:disulfide interchange protein DsbD